MGSSISNNRVVKKENMMQTLTKQGADERANMDVMQAMNVMQALMKQQMQGGADNVFADSYRLSEKLRTLSKRIDTVYRSSPIVTNPTASGLLRGDGAEIQTCVKAYYAECTQIVDELRKTQRDIMESKKRLMLLIGQGGAEKVLGARDQREKLRFAEEAVEKALASVTTWLKTSVCPFPFCDSYVDDIAKERFLISSPTMKNQQPNHEAQAAGKRLEGGRLLVLWKKHHAEL